MAIVTLAPPMNAAAGLGHTAERSRVWRKFVRNPAAIAGAVILLIVIGAAIFAPYVAPH
jgi:peptide/nickel transport system permease protein